MVQVIAAQKQPTMQVLALNALQGNRSRKGMSRQAIHRVIVEGFGLKDGPQFKGFERRMFDQAVEKELLVKLGGCFKLGPQAKVVGEASKAKKSKKEVKRKVSKVGSIKKVEKDKVESKRVKQIKQVAKVQKENHFKTKADTAPKTTKPKRIPATKVGSKGKAPKAVVKVVKKSKCVLPTMQTAKVNRQ
eukprot:Platyproteum_vivax@DN7542_c0_g1_i15.p1